MMKLDIYQIDAFTSEVFSGNPAAVCPVEEWPEDDILLKIAIENNLAETAYFRQRNDGTYDLRWFTPEIEMDLCGHATLASAFVIFEFLNHTDETVQFHTKSGILSVRRANGWYEMDLPSRPPVPSELPDTIVKSLSVQPLEVWKARDYMLVYENERIINDLQVSAQVLEDINLDPGGIICTAPGDDVHFVSRFFTPGAAIFEDPVTGSAHCTMIPFWADRLNTNSLIAHQISNRGGLLHCSIFGDRVIIKGQAVCYMQGTIYF